MKYRFNLVKCLSNLWMVLNVMFLGWFFGSMIDIICKNLWSIPLCNWNMFQIIINNI